MFSLIADVVLHTVEIVSMQPETQYVSEKTEEATAWVVEKTCPSQITNAYGYQFNGVCDAPASKAVEAEDYDDECWLAADDVVVER